MNENVILWQLCELHRKAIIRLQLLEWNKERIREWGVWKSERDVAGENGGRERERESER